MWEQPLSLQIRKQSNFLSLSPAIKLWLRKSSKCLGFTFEKRRDLTFLIVQIVMMTWESTKASRLSWQWHKKGQRAQANWVAAIQVMLSKVIYNAVAAGHVNCWNHRNWNLSDRIPNIGSWKNVLPCEPKSESLIVTLTYFALFKEVLPCMFL